MSLSLTEVRLGGASGESTEPRGMGTNPRTERSPACDLGGGCSEGGTRTVAKGVEDEGW